MGSRIGVGLLAAAGILVFGGTALADLTFASSWQADGSNSANLTAPPNFPVTGTSGGNFQTTFVIRAIFDGPTSFLYPTAFLYFGEIEEEFQLQGIELSEDGTLFTPVLLAPVTLGEEVANTAYGFDVSGVAANLRDGVKEVLVRILLDDDEEAYVQITGVSNPEPATITLFAVGLGAASFAGYRRRRKAGAAQKK